jgi:hypothetical protein
LILLNASIGGLLGVVSLQTHSARYHDSGQIGRLCFYELITNTYLFRADDLIPEESELVQQAIKRLPPKEAYDRVFRLRRAFQVSLLHMITDFNRYGNQLIIIR